MKLVLELFFRDESNWKDDCMVIFEDLSDEDIAKHFDLKDGRLPRPMEFYGSNNDDFAYACGYDSLGDMADNVSRCDIDIMPDIVGAWVVSDDANEVRMGAYDLTSIEDIKVSPVSLDDFMRLIKEEA